jgi:hypothetical protein
MNWSSVVDVLKNFGLTRGLCVIFFLSLWWFYHRAHQNRLKDKDAEINRLAADNHEYRERFMRLFDDKYKIQPYSDPNQSGGKK